MSINASSLKAGMHLIVDIAYVHIERVRRDSHDMLTAFIRDSSGRAAAVRFHGAEHLTVAV